MDNAAKKLMTMEDCLAAKKSCQRSSFNIGFAVVRECGPCDMPMTS